MAQAAPLALPGCDDNRIWDVWLSAFHAPTLVVAEELGVFNALAQHAACAAELARQLRLEVRATEGLACLLTSLGFLLCAEGRYHLTPLARHYLLPDSPYYWGAMLKRMRQAPIDCAKMAETLRRSGAEQEQALHKMWAAPTLSAEQLREFTHVMHAHSLGLAMRVIPALQLNEVNRLLDVAGGSGSFSIAAATQHVSLECVVLDLPVVCAVACEYIEKFQLQKRVAVMPRDMFAEAWPDGFDRVFFNDIFHDWDDEHCQTLANHAFTALRRGGKVQMHEMLLADAKDGPPNAAAYSMAMILLTRGRQRTAQEMRVFVERAGFSDVRIVPTATGYASMEGTKAAQ